MTMMRLERESDILDPDFRKHVMKEINSEENKARKAAAYRRYEIYKKKIAYHLKQNLVEEGFRDATIKGMMSRSTSIGYATKIINKKARCYQFGVTRTTGNDEVDERIGQLARVLNVTESQKKVDRFSELHMNAAMLIVPVPVDEDETSFTLEWRPLQPWSYDVIEDPNRPERGKIWILTDYSDEQRGLIPATEAEAGVHYKDRSPIRRFRNRFDDTIADNPLDQGEGRKVEPIWWSDNYHFTTSPDGSQIKSETTDNPIQRIPIVNYAIDQDGFFWAEGGDDIIEGTVLLNKMQTELNFILTLQGFGIPIISGINLPNDIEYGPGRPIYAEKNNAEDPDIKVDFVNPSPPVDGWMRTIEMDLALLLSTNEVSPGSVANTLNAQNFQSGIAMMLDKAEAVNEIDDKQSMFVDGERQSWDITFRWKGEFGNRLIDDLDVGPIPDDAHNLMSFKFHDAKVMETEKERLENIKLRKELGINEQVDLILIDNPDMTREEAEEKVASIREERRNNAMATMGDAIRNTVENDENEDGDQ